jgi:anti-anti-sigma factor
MADTPKFELTVISDGHAGPLPTVKVIGDIDLITSPILRDELLQTLATSRGGAVVDLQDVEFMDAAGIGALVAAANFARENGGRFGLRHTSRAVDRILDLFDLATALPRLKEPAPRGAKASWVEPTEDHHDLTNLGDQLGGTESRTAAAIRLRQLRLQGYTIDRMSNLTGINSSEILVLLAEAAANGSLERAVPGTQSD